MDHDRVNRNDPCPCGSGKKYKHCCRLKQLIAEPPRPVTTITDLEGKKKKRRTTLSGPWPFTVPTIRSPPRSPPEFLRRRRPK